MLKAILKGALWCLHSGLAVAFVLRSLRWRALGAYRRLLPPPASAYATQIARVSSLRQRPAHIALALPLDTLHDLSAVARVVWYCVAARVRCVSVHDPLGLLQSAQGIRALADALRRTRAGVQLPGPSARAGHALRVRSAAGDVAEVAVPFAFDGAAEDGAEAGEWTVNVTSAADGRGEIVELARNVAGVDPAAITCDYIESNLKATQGQPDPDLMIIFDQTLVMSGFLPWQIRLTEFMYPLDLFGWEEFVEAVDSYSRRNKRFAAPVPETSRFTTFEALLCVPQSFLHDNVRARKELAALREVALLGAKLDAVSRALERELLHAGALQECHTRIYTADSVACVALRPLLAQARSVCAANVGVLQRESSAMVARLAELEEAVALHADANRGVAEELAADPLCAHVATAKECVAAVEELLLLRIDAVDVFSGDELCSDSYPVKEEGCCYVVEGKMITVEEGGDYGISANQDEDAEAGAAADGILSTKEQVINFVQAHRLTETSYTKKLYMAYIKAYMGRLKAHLEQTNPGRVAAFQAEAATFVKGIISKFDDYRFFIGSSMDSDAMNPIIFYKEDGITPCMYLFKDGVSEEKY
eukprot:m51a1_g2700 hypothetical protein (592) ;mRNA; f:800347-803764